MSSAASRSMTFVGTNGNDTITGTAFRDFIYSLGGNDVINSGAGDDVIYTGSGNDVIDSGTGDDLVVSGSGDDLVIAGSGDDVVYAGAGNDTVYAGDGNDFVEAGSGNDNVYGGSGNDEIWGQAGNDSLYGGAGVDFLSGDSGNDLLSGGTGKNVIMGGSGLDTALYDGSILSYTVAATSCHGLWVFRDQSADFDVLVSVEKLRFDDFEVWVNGTNNPVLAKNDSASVTEGQIVSVNVLSNDFDFDGDSFQVTSVNGVSPGSSVSIVNGNTVVFNAGTAFDYLAAGETAIQALTYTVTDARGGVATASLNIEIIGVGSLPHLVFFDDFERPNNTALGNGWVELRETEAADPNFFGSATVNVADGHASFLYVDNDGDPAGATRFEQPYVYHDLSQNVADTGFNLEFDFTVGASERVRQFFGLADSSQGVIETNFVPVNPILIPVAGLGIEIVRSYSGNPNSSIKVWQFSGDGDFQYEDPNADELVDWFFLQSFQFEAGEEYQFSFSVTDNGELSLSVSDGLLVETFTGLFDNMPTVLDQLVCSSIETGAQGTDDILVDNISLFTL